MCLRHFPAQFKGAVEDLQRPIEEVHHQIAQKRVLDGKSIQRLS
jgi:hypothetical protein